MKLISVIEDLSCLEAVTGLARLVFFYQVLWIGAAHLVLGTAQHDLPVFEQLANGFIRHPNARLLGQVISQSLERPHRVRLPQAARPPPHHKEQLLCIRLRDLGRCSWHRSIFQSFDPFGKIPFEPVADGLVIFAYNGCNGRSGQSLLSSQKHDLSTGT